MQNFLYKSSYSFNIKLMRLVQARLDENVLHPSKLRCGRAQLWCAKFIPLELSAMCYLQETRETSTLGRAKTKKKKEQKCKRWPSEAWRDATRRISAEIPAARALHSAPRDQLLFLLQVLSSLSNPSYRAETVWRAFTWEGGRWGGHSYLKKVLRNI